MFPKKFYSCFKYIYNLQQKLVTTNAAVVLQYDLRSKSLLLTFYF